MATEAPLTFSHNPKRKLLDLQFGCKTKVVTQNIIQ